MTRGRALAAALAVAGSLPVAAATPCAAAEGAAHRAAIVVEFEPGRVHHACVGFDEPSLTGLEALERSGLEIAFKDWGAGNVTVCRIEGEGCDHPREPCWCSCADPGAGDCAYWGYYRVDGETGGWRFSERGAAVTEVRDGDVEGWRWGTHGTRGGAPPPRAALDRVCSRAQAAPAAPRSRQGGFPTGAAVLGVALAAMAAWAARARHAKERVP